MPAKRRGRESGGGERLFVPEMSRTEAGSIRIEFRPAPPLRSLYGYERELCALIYDLAAALERRFGQLGANWAVAPEPWNGRISIEFDEADHPEAAAEVVAEVLSAMGLV